MKQLLLLRHAHAEDALPGAADIDRPLSVRGRAEALDAAQCIAAAGLRCESLLVSPALRTRETATIVAAELDIAEPPRFDAALYLGNADALLTALQQCADGLRTLLLVAHNPGLNELAQRFQATPPLLELRTAGVCLISFDNKARWGDLRPQLATALRLLR
ncbi:MAG TPA: histidine phosphatase family protein [Steroidobacteraceae bacterium]|jgi:phosphohistidine phosphatase|nr:histidine phosphatase family protein [Steroidobacteraceae bacterium]